MNSIWITLKWKVNQFESSKLNNVILFVKERNTKWWQVFVLFYYIVVVIHASNANWWWRSLPEVWKHLCCPLSKVLLTMTCFHFGYPLHSFWRSFPFWPASLMTSSNKFSDVFCFRTIHNISENLNLSLESFTCTPSWLTWLKVLWSLDEAEGQRYTEVLHLDWSWASRFSSLHVMSMVAATGFFEDGLTLYVTLLDSTKCMHKYSLINDKLSLLFSSSRKYRL